MSSAPLLTQSDSRGVTTLTLNRSPVHNAFDEQLIVLLLGAVDSLAEDAQVRVVILSAAGPTFCAGADLRWMQRMANADVADNEADAAHLAKLLNRLANLPQPTIARIQGSAYGGGGGLIACCDIAVASEKATFCLSETRLGLIPAVVAPYVVRAIGARTARRSFVSAESFDATEASRIGLVHAVVPSQALGQTVDDIATKLLANGPKAMTAAKRLVTAVDAREVDDALIADTVRRIAERRASAEGQEGVRAFLEKRAPSWRPK